MNKKYDGINKKFKEALDNQDCVKATELNDLIYQQDFEKYLEWLELKRKIIALKPHINEEEYNKRVRNVDFGIEKSKENLETVIKMSSILIQLNNPEES